MKVEKGNERGTVVFVQFLLRLLHEWNRISAITPNSDRVSSHHHK